MAKNRLNLVFSLKTNSERVQYVDNYLPKLPNPSAEELEKIADYILWGKNESGQSDTDEGLIEIETVHKTWSPSSAIESLDALFESETFTEASLHPLNFPPTKLQPQKFLRSEARKNEDLAQQLDPIWQQIDTLELMINFYDLAHNKRKKPPRDELLRRFDPIQIEDLKEKASHLNIFQYLKRRHLLVELRREQYTIADQFKPSMVLPHKSTFFIPSEPNEIETDFPVYPLGIFDNSEIASLIFQDFETLGLSPFNDDQLKKISAFLRFKDEHFQPLFFNLADENHLIVLFESYNELKAQDPSYLLLKTVDYYIYESNLKPIHYDILSKKLSHIKNQDIAAFVNKKYETNYMTNYISTIYRQKIIPQIAEAVKMHQKIIENVFFPENFKKCNTCGKSLLISSDNFVRKSHSNDGYANRCKECDKLLRKTKMDVK